MWKYISSDDELYHYGILGMRWGHRKAKYGNSKDYNRAHGLRKRKNYKQMSNNELQTVNKRLELENRYRKNSSQATLGKRIVSKLTGAAATAGSLAAGYEIYKRYGQKYVSKYIKRYSIKKMR